MFILNTDHAPANTADLLQALTQSITQAIQLPKSATPIVITGELPNLTSLIVDVSGGEIDPESARENLAKAESLLPGPEVATFKILANPGHVNGIPADLNVSAERVTFGYGHNTDGKLIATLVDAAKGQLSVYLSQQNLQAALLHLAQKYSASTGVAIQKVDIALTSISAREVDVLLEITAKKFVTAIVRIVGQISVNDEMVATAKNLKASSTGMVGSIAVNLLQPHLQKLDGQPLPLMAFSLGSVKLRDVQADTSDGLRLKAVFGSEAM